MFAVETLELIIIELWSFKKLLYYNNHPFIYINYKNKWGPNIKHIKNKVTVVADNKNNESYIKNMSLILKVNLNFN